MKILKGFCIFWVVFLLFIVAYCAVRVSTDPFLNGKGAEKAEAYIVSTKKAAYLTSNVSVNGIKLEKPGKTVMRFKSAEGEDITAEFPYYFVDVPEDRIAYILYLEENPRTITLDIFGFNGFDVVMVGIMSTFPICLGTLMLAIYLILKNEKKRFEKSEK